MPALALAALVGLAPAACVPIHPGPTRSSSPAQTPLFSSDEEALKAATDAYAAYLKVSDEISHDGGANPERIKPYASGSALQLALKSAAQFRAANAHSVGATAFSGVRLQSAAEGGRRVAIYACEDVSRVDVLDASGASIVKPDRKTLSAFLVTLRAGTDQGKLKVEDRETWPIDGICSRT
jgi:hypothetical protein